MGASIHINGTGSSVIDTIFVCRSTGKIPRKWLVRDAQGAAGLVEEDLQNLRLGNVAPTRGDIRCLVFGHLARLAIWACRKGWDKTKRTAEKMAALQDWIERFGGQAGVEQHLEVTASGMPRIRIPGIREAEAVYQDTGSQISF